MTTELEALYQEVILDHFKTPRCRGCLEHAASSATLYNPLCGDQIHLTANVKESIISEIKFEGQGCSISQASASMLTTLVEGKTLTEAKVLIEHFKSLMRGEKSAEELEGILGDVVALEGVRKFSARVKCAMLAWEALEKIEKELSSAQ